MDNVKGESVDLNELFKAAANSRLTPTAAEFVPRSSNFGESETNRSNGFHDDSYYQDYSMSDQQLLPGSTAALVGNSSNNPYFQSQNMSEHDVTEENSFPNPMNFLNNSIYYNSNSRNRNRIQHFDRFYMPRTNSTVSASTSRTSFNQNPRFFTDNVRRHEMFSSDNEHNNVAFSNDSHSSRYTCSSSSLFSNDKYKKNTKSPDYKSKKFNGMNADENLSDLSICQRDDLTEQLKNATLECLVCYEKIKQREPTWNCGNCYHVLHFWCVVRWAKSSKNDSTCWRCPACQNENKSIPGRYVCFCGRATLRNDWNRIDVPHSCGGVCSKRKHKNSATCSHRCTLQCHPGPCPPCSIQVTRKCGCGKTNKFVQCGASVPVVCDNICNKTLNCGTHYCNEICHPGGCKPCDDTIAIGCYCGQTKKEVVCRPVVDERDRFSCGSPCKRTLDCGNHNCLEICHQGPCKICDKLPSVVTVCPCGKTKFNDYTRSSCVEPVPICDNRCGKLLTCGSPQKPHFCQMKCHDGDCSPCKKETSIKCRCGNNSKIIPCADLGGSVSDFSCKKRCTKKRKCGKHKCNQVCCIDFDHNCPVKCSGMLTCGQHRCELLCHPGKCGNCLQSSFDDLFCNCGKTVMYAPIACGTKPPVCDYPCIRSRPCNHDSFHNCHSTGPCPPCTVFTDKFCYGRHELRRTIPCYQKEFSCGLPCGQRLPCELHTCIKVCHSDVCLQAEEKCTQPCVKRRPLCGHPCNVPCHPEREMCPTTMCRVQIKVSCQCENRIEIHPCSDHSADFQQIVSSTLASQMAQVQLGEVVNTADASEKIEEKRRILKVLECNEECSIIMRNKRLALCLQIQNPDLSSKVTPQYTDFMKQWAKRDPELCQHIHEKLSSLVQLAKESNRKSRSYSFEVMNKDKRQLVHEYCAHFGCDSQAYDAEPKRNVVATAVKDKCWLPSYSLMQVVKKEMGYRKVHHPAFGNKKAGSNAGGGKSEELTSTMVIMPVVRNSSTS